MAFSKPKAHERAERYAAKGQHDKAAREYQSIVENDPKDVRAWLMLADCLVRCGDKPGAVERYERVAQYYIDAKEHNKALAVFRQVLALDGQRLDVQLKVAGLNLQVGHTQDAVAIYERVAHAQLQAGRVAEALHTYRLVADADPTVVARRLRLAELYSREKQLPEAVEAFRMAGQQLRQSGRVADYVRVAERLLYHADQDLPTIRDLARAYLELGDPRRAIMKLNGLLRAHPKDEEGIELLADTFMALGKPEKALSALEELARGLRARGPEARTQAIRILRRGLEWRPAHAEFREALLELEGRRRTGASEPVPPADEPDDDESDIETVEEGDFVELDEDDLVEDADELPSRPSGRISLPETISSAPGTRGTGETEAQPSAVPSLTQSVLSEVEADAAFAGSEGLTDLDKILFEARVYIKYRLFDHALEHVRTALQQQPMHVGAMIVQARAFTELGRAGEAAQSHLFVAELVAASDPKLAQEQLAAARSLAPEHPDIDAVAKLLAPVVARPVRPARVAATPQRAPAEDIGDSGAFDLVGIDDDLSPPGIALDLAGEAPANLLPADEEEDLERLGPAQTGRTMTAMPVLRDDVESLGPIESLVPEVAFDLEDTPPPIDALPTLASDVDTQPVDVEPMDGEVEGRFGAEVSMADLELDVEPDESLVMAKPDFTEAEPELAVEPEPEPEPEPETEPETEPALAAEPPPAEPPPAEWPDITGELDEIQFYIDQGLDDDAEAALDDLESQYPGHPEIAKRRRGHEPEIPVVAAPALAKPVISKPVISKPVISKPVISKPVVSKPVVVTPVVVTPEPEPEPEPDIGLDFALDDEEDAEAEAQTEAGAAEPLVSLDDEPAESPVTFEDDDDDDAYLSAIFADPVKPKPKLLTEESTPGANLAAGQSMDAATAFDLGVAYREMGLVDAAITQFETASRDSQWRARALTLLGSLRLHRGETDQAVADLKEAVQLATTPAEASESAYELGVLYGVIGDSEAAIQQLLTVAPGYRDRDERLAELGF